MVGILVSFWDGLFLGATLNFGGVNLHEIKWLQCWVQGFSFRRPSALKMCKWMAPLSEEWYPSHRCNSRNGSNSWLVVVLLVSNRKTCMYIYIYIQYKSNNWLHSVIIHEHTHTSHRHVYSLYMLKANTLSYPFPKSQRPCPNPTAGLVWGVPLRRQPNHQESRYQIWNSWPHSSQPAVDKEFWTGYLFWYVLVGPTFRHWRLRASG